MARKTGLNPGFEAVFDALPDAVAILDESGKIVNANTAYTNLFRAAKRDLIGKSFMHFEPMSDAVRELFMTEMVRELRESQPVQFETLVTTDNGSAAWTKVTATLLEYEGQTLCLTTLHDINDRRRIEVGLRRSGEKLRQIFHSVSDGILVTDLRGVVTEINQQALEIYGYSQERDVLGKHVRELNNAGNEELARITLMAVQRGTVKGQESTIRRRDGTEVFLEISVSILRTTEEEPQGFVAILRDVTKRKETEELYRRVVTASPVGIYIAQHGKFRFVNPRFQEISGYSEDELLEMQASDIVHPDDRQTTRDRAVLMVKGNPVPPGEFRIITKDGRTKWAMETISSIVYHGTRASLGNFVDITERHGAEIALRRALDTSETSRAEVLALLEASQVVLAHPIFTEAAGAVFQICQKLTGATGGYVALLDESGTKYNALCMEIDAISCASEHALSMPPSGLQSEIYQSDKPFYENDFANSRWAQFIPPAHVCINNVLFAPLTVGGRPAGLVGLANKPGGFTDDDSRLVAGLANFMAIALSNSRAWESLEKSENRYRDLYNHAPIAFFAVGTDGTIQTANDKSVALLGYSMIELVSMPMSELYADTHFGKEKARTLAILATYGKIISGEELQMQRKDGERIWVSLSVEPVRDDDGIAAGSRIAALDITDRKEAEIALEASQARFRELADLLPLSVWETDTEGRFLYTNKEMSKSYGYVQEEVEKTNIFDRFVPDDRERVLIDMKAIASHKKTLGSREYSALRKDGSTFPVLVYSSPVIRNDHVVGLRGISIDITERKLSETALLRSEGRARSVTETATDAIISIDHNGDVILWNPAAELMFGYSATEMTGQQVTLIMQKTDRNLHTNGVDGLVAGGEPRLIGHTVETIGLRKSGESFPIELSLADWTTDEGRFFTAIIRDITERKKLDEELLRRMEELQDANLRLKELDKLKDGFMSTVSHELRTPLTAIKGFAEFLLAYDEDRETQKEILGIINDESDRLTRLINDILDLSKIQAGRMQWETSPVSLPLVIETVLHSSNSLITKNKLVVLSNIPGDLPQVLSDKDRIVQVVTNLLSNAIKFTPEGGEISISASAVPSDEPLAGSGMVMVSISDSGIGIDPENHERIFEKFTQVGDPLKDRPIGTGLGLPICKEIVEHYGGRIWVESQLRMGSVFRFTLPMAPPS